MKRFMVAGLTMAVVCTDRGFRARSDEGYSGRDENRHRDGRVDRTGDPIADLEGT